MSCARLCDPVDCSLSGSSVHGILQTRIQEWAAIPFSRGLSQPRDRTWVSWIAGGFLTVWATTGTWASVGLLGRVGGTFLQLPESLPQGGWCRSADAGSRALMSKGFSELGPVGCFWCHVGCNSLWYVNIVTLPEKWFLLRWYSCDCLYSPQNTVNFNIVFLADIGSGNPLQYSCLGNAMDWGAWRATVHGVAKRWTRLSDWGYIFLEFFSF